MYSGNVKIIKTFDEKEYHIYIKPNEELDKLYNKTPEHVVFISISKAHTEKTEQQVRTIHALLNAWFFTGCHSAPDDCLDTDRFKLWAKVQFGKCSEVEVNGKLVFVPWSIADYSKDDLSDFIDKIITAIDMSGATSDKLEEIRKGMFENTKINGYGG